MIVTAQQRGDAHSGIAHETSDVPLRPLLIFILVLFVIGAVMHVAVWRFMSVTMAPGVSGAERALPFSAVPRPPVPAQPIERLLPDPVPQPQLQVDPSADLQQLREREERILQTWTTDPDSGRTRMPIERAMKRLVERAAASASPPIVTTPRLAAPPTDAGGRRP